MAFSRSQLIVSSVFLAVAMGTVVSLYLRASSQRMEDQQSESQRRAEAAQPVRRNTVLVDRIVLVKDEPLVRERVRIVYRGRAEGRILLDLTLLDLDPSYAYPRQIAEAEARAGFKLGDRRYRLHATSRNAVTLKFAD